MSKITNKHQLQLLLALMQSNPDIARGFHKGSREDYAIFWSNVTVQLNSAGPPCKSTSEWKKVWSDQKKYVRKKAIKLNHCSPKMSSNEEAIYDLIGMNVSEECTGMSKQSDLGTIAMVKVAPENAFYIKNEAEAFLDQEIDKVVSEECTGMSKQSDLGTVELAKVAPENDFYIKNEAEEIDEVVENYEEMTAYSPQPKGNIFHNVTGQQSYKTITPNTSSTNALNEEFLMPQAMCDTIKAAASEVKELQQCTREIYLSVEKFCDLQKQHFKTMEMLEMEKLDEMKRHNLVMERLRLREVEDKIENNRRSLELNMFAV